MKKDDENAKNPQWQVPMDLPHAKPEDYDKSIESGRGSAQSSRGQSVTPEDGKRGQLSRDEMKQRGMYPLNDEEIGGA